ncbi:MAG: hypothetical protein Unbinned3528contig1000_49 [Prokaryotic dsDNA virus sp.]|nr:MAG: hypothetical protein Unbinned3528contig1000_49 [Prokaryotic dsDNA virus sp.]|tara:strand:- start:16957 stop:17679 length:723 start_codon:yes stop_codon:yes gene_type:complete
MNNLEIKTTKDYSIFKYVVGNRTVNTRNKNRLKISINKIGQQMPMLVSEKDPIDNKYPIIDGQHRLEAIKSLHIPVDFIVSTKTNTDYIDELQVSKQWTAVDFCKRNAALGSINCKKALKIAYQWNAETKSKFTILNVLDLLNKSIGSSKQLLKNKNYQIDLDRATRVYQACYVLGKYPNQFSNVFAARLVTALKRLDFKVGGLDIKLMEKIAKKHYLNYYQSISDQLQYMYDLYIKYNK